MTALLLIIIGILAVTWIAYRVEQTDAYLIADLMQKAHQTHVDKLKADCGTHFTNMLNEKNALLNQREREYRNSLAAVQDEHKTELASLKRQLASAHGQITKMKKKADKWDTLNAPFDTTYHFKKGK